MSRLTSVEIIELIEVPENGTSLRKAVDHELKVQVHTEPVDNDSDYDQGHRDFLIWAENVIGNKKKFQRFIQFLKFPYATNEITDSVFDQLSKVFESRNSFRSYKFKNSANTEDFISYLAEISDPFFWRFDVWEAIKNNINSVIVIDMRSTEEAQPNPYSYVVKTPDIIDMKNTAIRSTTVDKKLFKTFKMEYLIFKDGDGIIALDDGHYRRYTLNKDNKPVLDIETPHDLGYCPSTQIYSEPFNKHDNIRKNGPLSTTISDLDLLLYFITFQAFSDSYVPNPVTIKYAEECNYVADNGVRCDQGVLRMRHPHLAGEFSFHSCPKCKEKSLVGPGEVLEVQPPRDKQEFDQIDALHFKQPPLEGLKYTAEDIQKKEDKILLKTVGLSDSEMNGQAKNIPQVLGGFESKKIILRKIAVNLEIAMKFEHATMAKLRYSDDFQGCTIFLGDEFFLETEKQLQEKLKEEKSNGNSEIELQLSRDKITETKHKNNPNILREVMFLSFLEPHQGQTIQELQKLKKDFPNLVTDVDFVIKINFNSFVKRYETEIEPIPALLAKETPSREKKIEWVKDKFIEYANQILQPIPPE